jgi:hypothetical protein
LLPPSQATVSSGFHSVMRWLRPITSLALTFRGGGHPKTPTKKKTYALPSVSMLTSSTKARQLNMAVIR